MSDAILSELRTDILPKHYRLDLSGKVDEGQLLFKKGSYVCLVTPFAKLPPDDFGSKIAKSIIRKAMTCIPVFWEKGLFLVYYGPREEWSKVAPRFTVDTTALRPVILQSIHFIDPSNGENVNSRTHWGPLKFGFCGRLINEIESMCSRIQQAHAPDQLPLAGDA